MPHYRDTNDNLHFIDDPKLLYLLPEGVIEITDEEAKVPKNKTKAQKITTLTAEYKADMLSLQMNYLSILCQDSIDEETKKSDARSEMQTRKAQYLSDIASVKSGIL